MIAAILGGGPSLPEQLKAVPDGAVFFGVNHHASKLVDCDYIVFNDGDTWDLVKDLPGQKISRWRNKCDIFWDSRPGLISGVCALNYCLANGYHRVYLAGFDCYQTDEYFHSPGEPTQASGATRSLERQLSYWPLDHRVRAIGGPLMAIYGRKADGKAKGFQEVEITAEKRVVLDQNRHVEFKPGVQTLRSELVEAAREAGILKEIE